VCRKGQLVDEKCELVDKKLDLLVKELECYGVPVAGIQESECL